MTPERSIAWVGFLTSAVLAAGCLQPSLHPLLRPQDSALDERLVGTWTCGDEAWTFSGQSETTDGVAFHHYSVEIAEDGKTATLRAWIGTLGTVQFINFFPDDDGRESGNRFFERHFLPVHTFGRLHIERDAVHLDMLSDDWIAEASKDGRLALGIETGSDYPKVLLTAPTAQLQAFARGHGDDAFGDRIELIRQRDRAPAPASARRDSGTGDCYTEK